MLLWCVTLRANFRGMFGSARPGPAGHREPQVPPVMGALVLVGPGHDRGLACPRSAVSAGRRYPGVGRRQFPWEVRCGAAGSYGHDGSACGA